MSKLIIDGRRRLVHRLKNYEDGYTLEELYKLLREVGLLNAS